MTHAITIQAAKDERPGWTEVNLETAGQDKVSNCGILALRMQIGAAVVRTDGIGGVNTQEAFRNRGLARHVLNAAVDHMTRGDAALTMLYGITNFYPKFGYTTAGPDYVLELPVPKEQIVYGAGWTVRAFEPADFDAVLSLYDDSIQGSCGAAVRNPDTYPWTRLRALTDDERPNQCRVVVDQHGLLRGYAWRGTGCGFMPTYDEDVPSKLMLSEAFADSSAAADVLLDACLNWGMDEATRRAQAIEQVVLYMPPEGIVASTAMTRTATFKQSYIATGGSMVRVLNVERLFRALEPEFRARLAASRGNWTGTLQLMTEIGGAAIAIDGSNVEVRPVVSDVHNVHTLDLPQSALAQFTMGSLHPDTILARLDVPPSAAIRALIETLFPRRHPHMFLVDRY